MEVTHRPRAKGPTFAEQVKAAQAQQDAVQAVQDAALTTAAATTAEDLIGDSEKGQQTPEPVSHRPIMRDAMREEDPRTRAARRAQELRDHGSVFEDTTDDFYVDPSDVPPGWAYEWKRKTILGAEDPAYAVSTAKAGWEPVPTSRHPNYMPAKGNHPVIERKGMILMERPLEINEESKHREYMKARDQVRGKEQQLSLADSGQFDRNNKDQSLVKIRKSYEPVPIPNE